MADATDTAINVTEAVGAAANLALQIGDKALPFVEFFAGFIPGAAPVVQALRVAMPIIQKIRTAVPIVAGAIEAGRPVINAIQASAPQIMPHLKELYAITVNHDPARPEQNLTAADVSDEEAVAFAGPVFLGRAWTQEETQRWFDKAQGTS